MIKIMFHGKDNKAYRHICKSCECDFLYNKCDLEDDRCGYSYIKCPECGHRDYNIDNDKGSCMH